MKRTRAELKAEMMTEIECEIDKMLDWEDQAKEVTITDLEDQVLAVRRRISEHVIATLAQQRVEKLETNIPVSEESGKRLHRKGKKTGPARRASG